LLAQAPTRPDSPGGRTINFGPNLKIKTNNSKLPKYLQALEGWTKAGRFWRGVRLGKWDRCG